MKRHMRRHMRLGDVIRVVQELSRNDQEASVVVADMINRGLIKFNGSRRHPRVVIR